MNLRTPITLAVLLLALLIGAGYGWSQVDAPFENPFAKPPPCVSQRIDGGEKLTRAQVVVNVYNAGSRDGLATSTLRSLAKRGFARGAAANAPERLQVATVTLLDPDPKAADVRLVRGQFKGKVEVRGRPDLGDAGVDVVVGNGYQGLKRVGPKSVRVDSGEEVCVPSRVDSSQPS